MGGADPRADGLAPPAVAAKVAPDLRHS